MNKSGILFIVLLAVGTIAFVTLNPSRTRSAADLPVTTFSNELPSAFGKWDVIKADTVAVLIDMTQEKLMGEIPEVAVTGKTVKITCKDSPFSVTPTNRQEAIVHEVNRPGAVVELTSDGPYTIVLFSDEATPKPTAVSYIVKMDEAELKELEDLAQPPPKQQVPPGGQSI